MEGNAYWVFGIVFFSLMFLLVGMIWGMAIAKNVLSKRPEVME